MANICVSDFNVELYSDIVKLLRELKLTLGPQGLSATLSRHKVLKRFMIEYQTEYLKNLEDKITLDD